MILRAIIAFRARVAAVAARVRAPQWVSLSLIALTLICAVVLAWLIYDTSLDKDAGLWGKFFLFSIGALAAIATVAVSWEPGETPPLKRLTSPWGAGLILLAVFGAFGTMTDALSLFEPRAATQADTGRIEEAVVRVDDRLGGIEAILARRFPANPPILSGIAGRWGEQSPACSLVWDIAVVERGDDAALVAELVERPADVRPFRLLAAIVSAEGNRMTVIGEEPESARGRAAEFTINSATGRLIWDDKSSAGGVEEYQRCPPR